VSIAVSIVEMDLEYPDWPAWQRSMLCLRLGLSWALWGAVMGLFLWPGLGEYRFLLLLIACLLWLGIASSHALYAHQLAHHCQLKLACKHIKIATRLTPWRSQYWLELGHVWADLGNWKDAEKAYLHALKRRSDWVEAWNGLGFAQLIKGQDWRSASASFARGYELHRGGDILPEVLNFSRFKLQHELEQWQWLLEQGLLSAAFERHIQELLIWLRNLDRETEAFGFVDLPVHTPLREVWGRRLYHESPEIKVGERALQALPKSLSLENQQQASDSTVPIIWDNFLQPSTLQALQRFCLNSTIWHDASRRAGYLASTIDDGFNCPLLYQIASEAQALFPDLLASYHLVYMWAFKCDSQGQGIALHNDSAVFNLNFWITPDEANLDPASGGLLIYPQAPPASWDFENCRIAQGGIETWLAAHPQAAIKIPYRCNRAVLFRSRLFHASDHYSFQAGYAQRRINITLLFGKKILNYYPGPTLIPRLAQSKGP
jgi:hypothetical protein